MLKPFAGYGFNKSHAAAYSVLAYKTAYCKANYPEEFWAANLTNEINDPDNFKAYLSTARKENIEILPPDINVSEKTFTVSDGRIVYGLMGIKGMGQNAAEAIINAREKEGAFTGIIDFLEKVDLRSVNKKVIETCVKVGLFDNIENRDRAVILHNIDRLIQSAVSAKKDAEMGQVSLFEEAEEELTADFTWENTEPFSKPELLQFEKDFLGFYVSGHPLDEYKDIWKKSVNLNLSNVSNGSTGKIYTVLGIVKNIKTIITRKNEKMSFGIIEDYNGSLNFVLYSQSYSRFGYMLEEDKIAGFKGKLDFRRNEPQIIVEEVLRAEELRPRSAEELHIELSETDFSEEELIELRNMFQDNLGSSPLYIHIKDKTETTVIKANSHLNLNINDYFMDMLKNHKAVESVWKE
jgi:DNA polymerase-3 subunit alpha